MAKTKMVQVSDNLVKAARMLQASRQWTQLPLDMRRLFERGLAGNGHTVRK
ncbi:hypothetical protein LCGC14_1256460 [marine sediment metagenome]|uniref:Uncharacterized protein n=1 Tax=marine sediment metagenome TaxID=412755 RepID=A0A0F9NIL5_9ZZZZ